MEEITQVNYNWNYSTDPQFGEEFQVHRIGEKGCVKIEYHPAHFEGDKHFCIVSFKDGGKELVFNINKIIIKEKPNA